MVKRTPQELIERQTPRGLVTHAREYFATAEIVGKAVRFDDYGGLKRPNLTHPFYYLVGHSIELSFKSMLLANGSSHEKLQKMGHDLIKAWTAARVVDAGVFHRDLFDAYEDDIRLLNVLYHAKDLEYRVTGAFTLPRGPVILDATREFFERANVVVGGVEKSKLS